MKGKQGRDHWGRQRAYIVSPVQCEHGTRNTTSGHYTLSINWGFALAKPQSKMEIVLASAWLKHSCLNRKVVAAKELGRGLWHSLELP